MASRRGTELRTDFTGHDAGLFKIVSKGIASAKTYGKEWEKAGVKSAKSFDNLRASVLGFGASLAGVAGLASATSGLAQIGDLAKNFGITTDQLQGLASASERSGVTMDKLRQALVQLKTRTADLDKNPAAFAALKSFNVDIEEFGRLDLNGKLLKVADGFAAAGDKTQAFKSLVSLLGDDALALVSLVGQGGDAIQQMADDAVKATEKQIEAAQRLTASWATLKREAMTLAAPLVEGVSDAAIGLNVIKEYLTTWKSLAEIYDEAGQRLAGMGEKSQFVIEQEERLAKAIERRKAIEEAEGTGAQNEIRRQEDENINRSLAKRKELEGKLEEAKSKAEEAGLPEGTMMKRMKAEAKAIEQQITFQDQLKKLSTGRRNDLDAENKKLELQAKLVGVNASIDEQRKKDEAEWKKIKELEREPGDSATRGFQRNLDIPALMGLQIGAATARASQSQFPALEMMKIQRDQKKAAEELLKLMQSEI